MKASNRVFKQLKKIPTSPSLIRSSPLWLASVEETNSSSGDLEIKMIFLFSPKSPVSQTTITCRMQFIQSQDYESTYPKISSSIGDLNNHLLSSDRSASECEFIASTAPVGLALSRDMSRSKSISQVIIHSPWLVIVASVCGCKDAKNCLSTQNRVTFC